jgi:5-methyltetrahydropteroyltriglutamate--homocysteine methyltransferase
VLSLGVIDGRNIWRADLETLLDRLEPIAATRDDRDRALLLAAPCAIDLALEPKLDDEIKQWLAFAVQKIDELVTLKDALNAGREFVAAKLLASSEAAAARKVSPRIHDAAGRRTHCFGHRSDGASASRPMRRAPWCRPTC